MTTQRTRVRAGRANMGYRSSMTRTILRSAASVGVIACMMGTAQAQDAEEGASHGGDIIVTANRRAADVSTIPYNISAVGSEQLAKTGVTDVASLSRQIPNLNVGSNGNRNLVAQVPIIRGLNATGSLRSFSRGQAPVSVYLGNVEGGNYFPIDDVQRVEVLRGPQGTLFGGGSLGGALRFIPNDPKLGSFEGTITGSAGVMSHSDSVDYSLGGTINIPMGEGLAFRASAKYQHEAGFIDKILDVRQEDGAYSPAVLADPSDFAGSSSEYYTNKDYNYSNTTSVRAALLWEPISEFKAVLAFNYAGMRGKGGPVDKSGIGGVDWIFDPSIYIPVMGDYQDFNPGSEPWKRDSYMASLDMSYDMGFATLSTTTSYLDTSSTAVTAGTLGIASLPAPIPDYYAGSPAFPRFLNQSVFTDSQKNFAQELRIVSPGNETIDYTLGTYYQHQTVTDAWIIYAPGNNAWAEYTDAPFFFPITGDELDRTLDNRGKSTFEQYAAYGELTFNPSTTLHITGGARVFHQKFKRHQDDNLIGFLYDVDPVDYSTSTTKVIFKGNISWDFADQNMAYATFSQGFRRGGVNTFPGEGPYPEPEALRTYKSDTVNNYEIGIKGRIAGWRYNLDVFLDDWSNVQIDTGTPFFVWPVVINGDKARSKGVEIELGGPITDNLSVQLGYAYADAKLTSDFELPANTTGEGGAPVEVPGAIFGNKGDRLPGSPKHSGSATITYDLPINDTDSFGASLNINYKGNVLSALPNPAVISKTLPDYFLVNGSLSYTSGQVTVSIYARNIFDKRAVLGFSQRMVGETPLNTTNNVTTPRQVGATLKLGF